MTVSYIILLNSTQIAFNAEKTIVTELVDIKNNEQEAIDAAIDLDSITKTTNLVFQFWISVLEVNAYNCKTTQVFYTDPR